MAIWHETPRKGKKHGTIQWSRLRVVRLPHRCPVPNAEGDAERFRFHETDWLRPRDPSGPIWLVYGDDDGHSSSFYVFPRGYSGPVWICIEGVPGWDAGHSTGFSLGPPDKRGYRILQGEYREPAADKYGGGQADDYYTWPNYWTGKNWGKKGPNTFRHVEPPPY